MSDQFSKTINELFDQNDWEKARELLEVEQKKTPSSHWILTQIGVTYYEQRQYKIAESFFRESLAIKSDCPLTLWNIAGVLHMLDNDQEAKKIYHELINSKETPQENPCWENQSWSDSLKSDCVHRLSKINSQT